MMFFYQGIISFLRGYPDNAFMLHKIALSILPKGEIIQKCQILSSLSTISLFIDSSFLFDRNQYLMKAEELHVSVQFKEALCYLKFHHSILHFINGDFVETQRLISSLASKYIPSKDFSPIRYQVENLLDWSSFAVGDIQFLSQRMSSTLLLLNGDDIPLGTMWYLELQSLCEILHGHYTLARQCLSSLGKYQMNHFGYYYQSTLLGFLMTCERKYLILSHDDPTSATTNIRYELFEKIIFSGKKLLERIQTSPIGMISLFLISYSALAILITTKEGKLHSTSSEQSIYSLKSPTTATIPSNMNRIPPPTPPVPPPPIRDTSNMTTHSSTSSGTNPFYESNSIYRPGGGTQYRLQSIAISCYHSLLKLSQKIPCLGILCDALELKFATFSGKKNSKFTMEYFEEIIYTMEYQQFAFGLLFWYLEKIYYCKNFNISLPYEEENDHNPPHPHPPHPPHPHHDTMTPTVPVESPLEIILQKYHIPENHFLLCQDFTIKKFSQTKRGIELSPHLPHHPSNPLSPLSGLSERKKEGGADGDGDDDVRDFIPDTITPFTPKNNPS